MRSNFPKELYWLLLTVVLIGISLYYVVNKTPFHLGLDINGGERAVLQAVPGPGQTVDSATIVKVITNRINASGVSEAVVQPKGTNQFIVELPNVRNKEAIINQLQASAQLEFYYFGNAQFVNRPSPRNPDAEYVVLSSDPYLFSDRNTGRQFRDQSAILADFSTIIQNSDPRPKAVQTPVPASLSSFAPTDQPLYLTSDQSKKLSALGQELDDYNGLIANAGAPVMTGADIKSDANAGFGGPTNGPVVNLSTTDAGVTKLANLSSPHVGELMAIVLDGKMLSVATISQPLDDGTCQITGGFPTLQDAQTLANFLNAGALPMPLKIIENLSVGAQLGPTAVKSSLIAGAIGLGAVLIFMGSYYLLPGLLADVALIIYALFTLAVFKGALGWLGLPYITLTLPGIAGFILSVGMAVDANILIFERLKEELRNGKSLKAAIDAGFSRAFSAIRDSNMCTLITCLILFSMGTAEVKGFAVTLGVGVLISLFTAITVTRTLLYILVAAGAGKNLALFGLGRQWEPKFNAVKNRKVFYAVSLLIIVPGLIATAFGGIKKGIDFTGGTQIQLILPHGVSRSTVEAAVAHGEYPFKDNLVELGQDSRGRSIALISIKKSGLNDYQYVLKDIAAAGLPYTVQEKFNVGPTISSEMTWDAFQAVVIASTIIVLYLAFAFSIGGFVAGLRFGASAIVALIHDVLVLIGVFAILGFLLDWQIDSLFVTALLTVVGFSVHDTIVIFDRLRENLRHRNKTESFENLANRSIQQSFARSINTSFTVLLTLTALLVFGEPTTKLLDWALLIGIISGTYSSIFNATPILVDWEIWLSRRSQSNPSIPAPYSPSTGGTAIAAASFGTLPTSDKSQPTDEPTSNGTIRHRPKKRTPARRF